nr:hypothetical protein [uncultured Campylobacter sp.]
MSNLKTRKTAAPKDEFIAKNIRSGSLIIPSKQKDQAGKPINSLAPSPQQSINLPLAP